MDSYRVSKWCRIIGKALIICAVLSVIGSWIYVNVQPPYYSADDDSRVVIVDLWALGCVGLGCVFLWLGSYLGPKKETDWY
jgi:hypothetical protein